MGLVGLAEYAVRAQVGNVADDFFHVLLGDRLGEEVALGLVAAAAQQEVELIEILDALGDDLHIDAVCHGNDGALPDHLYQRDC